MPPFLQQSLTSLSPYLGGGGNSPAQHTDQPDTRRWGFFQDYFSVQYNPLPALKNPIQILDIHTINIKLQLPHDAVSIDNLFY